MSSVQLGFGSLRLPKDRHKNISETICRDMVDTFIREGGKYFEVAHAYPQTEEVIGGILSNLDRDSYILTDKMPINGNQIKKEEDYQKIFNQQLERCNVDFFDYYLLHNVGYRTFLRSEELGAFRFLKSIKQAGLAKEVGFSFHDSASVLDEILSKYSDIIDVVQLQINYLDWESPVIQSRQCYEITQKYQKTVFVMEPIKGGRLMKLPSEAETLIREICPNETASSLALRFPASLDSVKFVLSGMTNTDEVLANLRVFKDFRPLSHEEKNMLVKIASIIHGHESIECTQCRYCEKVCPKHIPIPDLFHLYENDNKGRVGRMYIRITEDQNRGKASDCIKCGRCELECSQKLPIRKLLMDVRKVYEPDSKIARIVKQQIKRGIGEKNVDAIRHFMEK